MFSAGYIIDRFVTRKLGLDTTYVNATLPADTVTAPFPDDLFKGGRYLGITIKPDDEMKPRQLITSAPFSFWSKDSDMFEGHTLSELDDRFIVPVNLSFPSPTE